LFISDNPLERVDSFLYFRACYNCYYFNNLNDKEDTGYLLDVIILLDGLIMCCVILAN